MQFEEWYHLLYISTDIPIRNPPSKHQRMVKEILDCIEVAKSGNLDPLLGIMPISCIGNTEIVAYCRYLQHMISILKDEGSTE